MGWGGVADMLFRGGLFIFNLLSGKQESRRFQTPLTEDDICGRLTAGLMGRWTISPTIP